MRSSEAKHHRTGSGYIPELDGFRVVLIFLVSWYHFWQQSWWTPYPFGVSFDVMLRTGYILVDGTILLSGFLLFMPYARAMLLGSELPSVKAFYRKRAARIFPSYYFIILMILLVIVFPWKLYGSTTYMVKDILTHVTMTFTFFPDTYMSTPIGGAAWTLAIELQAYLIFPWLARAVMKKPVPVLAGMMGISWLWRWWMCSTLYDFSMVVNQLPSFLDVYALGIIGSLFYVWLTEKRSSRIAEGKGKTVICIIGTLAVLIGLLLLSRLLKAQAAMPGYAEIQRGQLTRRLPLACIFLVIMLALPFAARPIRFLMGNRLMRYLASISMNYYLIHQTLAVHLRRLGFPPSVSETPNYAGEMPWQWQYTLCCLVFSLILAMLITRFVEKPCAKWLNRRFTRADEKRNAPDPRMERLAEELVKCSCAVQPGEKVWIEAEDVPGPFVADVVRQIRACGGMPLVKLRDTEVDHVLAEGCDDSLSEWYDETEWLMMQQCSCHIRISGRMELKDASDPAPILRQLYARQAARVDRSETEPGVRSIRMHYPGKAMAHAAGMSPEAFQNLYFAESNLVDAERNGRVKK